MSENPNKKELEQLLSVDIHTNDGQITVRSGSLSLSECSCETMPQSFLFVEEEYNDINLNNSIPTKFKLTCCGIVMTMIEWSLSHGIMQHKWNNVEHNATRATLKLHASMQSPRSFNYLELVVDLRQSETFSGYNYGKYSYK